MQSSTAAAVPAKSPLPSKAAAIAATAVPAKSPLPSKAVTIAATNSSLAAVATLPAAGRRTSEATVAQLRLLLFLVLCRPFARRPRVSAALTAGAAGGVGRASSSVASLASVAVFFAADVALRNVFAAHAIAFPSSLAGMLGLFVSLLALQTAAPAAARTAVAALAPGASLLTKFLPLFFVPSLVVLPLQPALGAGDAAKLAVLAVGGWAASVAATGWTLRALAKLAGPATADAAATADATGAPQQPALVTKAVPAPGKSAPPFGPGLQRALASATVLAGAAAVTLAPSGAALGPGGTGAAGAALLLMHGGASARGCEAAFALCATALAFVSGSRLPAAVRKVAHPVLVTAVATVASLRGFAGLAGLPDLDGPLARYVGRSLGPGALGAGDLLLFCLGPSVLTFGLEMFARRRVMAARWVEVCGSAVAASVVGLFGTVALARALGLAEPLRLATATRQITSPLALSCAGMLGADASVAVALVVVTGLLGANFGGAWMTALGLQTPAARGLAMGATAHGLGTASLAGGEPDAFAFSAVAMALAGTVTAALVAMPPVRAALRATAGLP